MNVFALTSQGTASSGGWLETLLPILMIVIMFAALYFFMLRPQKKKEKEAKAMRDNVQVGDEVTTIGGIIGKVISIKEETCMIETGHDHMKIRILKSAIHTVDVKAEDSAD